MTNFGRHQPPFPIMENSTWEFPEREPHSVREQGNLRKPIIQEVMEIQRKEIPL